jgi:hypothetical protein
MMSLVSVLGCGTWFFLIEEQLYFFEGCSSGGGDRCSRRIIHLDASFKYSRHTIAGL